MYLSSWHHFANNLEESMDDAYPIHMQTKHMCGNGLRHKALILHGFGRACAEAKHSIATIARIFVIMFRSGISNEPSSDNFRLGPLVCELSSGSSFMCAFVWALWFRKFLLGCSVYECSVETPRPRTIAQEFSAWDSSRGNVRKVVCELWTANLRFQIISWSYRIRPSFGNFRMERAFKNLRLSALFCPF